MPVFQRGPGFLAVACLVAWLRMLLHRKLDPVGETFKPIRNRAEPFLPMEKFYA